MGLFLGPLLTSRVKQGSKDVSISFEPDVSRSSIARLQIFGLTLILQQENASAAELYKLHHALKAI